MKKQSGFTLIELMVVMAIIAILATAGLSAYTGYLKKARDTTRIADLDAIQTIIQATLGSTGKPPAGYAEAAAAVLAANNNVAVQDPLGAPGSAKVACMTSTISTTAAPCAYVYHVCDSGSGFAVGAKLESASNQTLYKEDGIGYNTSLQTGTYGYEAYYELGSCQSYDVSAATATGADAKFGYL